ncbi:PH domain-containing protein [Streptomyces sp. NBC_01190]|uniref:PH domain-containing protein n=1 Tax=Streptomyces sp. NBC_01190 TaxID=2903767 RepID=UPI0038704DB1|nr:PH domain-containing protein [Streptomyces sp. NBC_01190]
MRSFNQERSGGAAATVGGQPQYADRVYRSAAGFAGGVLLLVLAAWLGGDAVVRGSGHTPWLALAGLLLAVPLVVAFTIRPAVYAGAEQLRIRNPFRTITLPWSAVDRIRASYSTELFSGERKFQLWAIPVSIRARKRASRQTVRAKAAGDDQYGVAGIAGLRRRPQRSSAAAAAAARGVDGEPVRAWSDQAVAELTEIAERHPVVEGEARVDPAVRWCWEIVAPAVAGAVVLIVLFAI